MNSEADTQEIVVRDSLYSRIRLSPMAQALATTPEFLRLQRIKQLGWVFVVWPGATHTRYEHSLGVYHLTREALERLMSLGASGGLEEPDPAELRTVEAAALLHDIGHYPYSHCIEELGSPIEPHERAAAALILGENLSGALRKWGVDPEEVIGIIQRTEDVGSRYSRVYRSLLSGALDVDKLDYLPRDARACNVPYGGVDTDRLLDSLRVLPGSRLGITGKGISPLHSLVTARQEMFDIVYWHHTNRACMVMLLRAVQDSLGSGALRPADLCLQDDASLLTALMRSTMPESTQTLVRSLQARRIHKRAVEFAFQSGDIFELLNGLFYAPAARKRLEIALAGEVARLTGLSVADHEILIDIPKPEKWEVNVDVYLKRPPVGLESHTTWTEATGMSAETLAAYERHQRRIRIVTTERLRERVRDLHKQLIGFLSRHLRTFDS